MANPATDKINNRNRKFFVIKETDSNVLTPPVASKAIIESAFTSTSQETTQSPSNEVTQTRGISEFAVDKQKEGSFNMTSEIRLGGVTGDAANPPQGADLFEGMMGTIGAWTGTLNGILAISATTPILIDLDAGSQIPGRVGTIKINAEVIFYNKATIDMTAGANGQITIDGITRGFGGTTDAGHAALDVVTLHSINYKLDNDIPSLSIWRKQDEIQEALQLSTINGMTMNLVVDGFQQLAFTGGFGSETYAEEGSLSAIALISQPVIVMQTGEGEQYKVGSRVYNLTQDEDNGGLGFEIIDVTGDTLTLGSNIAAQWEANDIITPWFPDVEKKPNHLLSKNTTIFVDGVEEIFRQFNLTFAQEVVYNSEEIGDNPVTQYAPGARTIDVSVIMTAEVGRYTTELAATQKGTVRNYLVQLGDGNSGSTMYISLPKGTQGTTTLTEADPFNEITTNLSFSEADGDNTQMEIVFV
jgi:hypothetical protein